MQRDYRAFGPRHMVATNKNNNNNNISNRLEGHQEVLQEAEGSYLIM